MNNNTLILKIADGKFWFNETGYVPIEQTNVPKEHLGFKTHIDIYWMVEMTKFNRELGRLSVNVIFYNCEHHIGFEDQNPKYEIKFLIFARFDWDRLEPLLFYHQKSKLLNHILVEDKNEKIRTFSDTLNITTKREIAPDSVIAPSILEITEDFAIDFNKSVFRKGYVECSVKSKKKVALLNLEIINDFILPEFDNIKHWFSKMIKKKKFNVTVKTKWKNFDLIECIATSDDIAMINEQFIESLKIQRTQQLSKTLKATDNKAFLFSSEDIFKLISIDERNVFQQDE